MAGEPQIVAHVSCGAASFVAWAIAIARYGDRVDAVNAFVAKEHPDNRRFLADCERHLGRRVTARENALTTRPSEGWPWPWNDFRTSDYAYAWDPARGAVASVGRAWVTLAQLMTDPKCLYAGEPLRDDEVPDMRRIPRGDVAGKSGLILLRY